MSEPVTPDPGIALDNPQEAPAFAQPGDRHPDGDGERPDFPAGGAVKLLGIASLADGVQRCFYLTYNRQVVGLEAGNRHSKNAMVALYGPKSGFLDRNWPTYSKRKKEVEGKIIEEWGPSSFDQATASRAHIEHCSQLGTFDLQGRLRGRGAHCMADGRGLVLHCGDKLLVSELGVDGRIKRFRWTEPGMFERYIYPADEAIPHPWHEPVGVEPVGVVLKVLKTWQWKRELIDPYLVLGEIGASMIGGALKWRPHMWVTGGKGTGKTTLNGKDGVIHRLLGRGQFRTGNASAAGIRQTLKNSTVPILFDEIEASTDNKRVDAVVELARVSASGDTMTRGGADHVAQEFTLQSCFWMSSINIPPLQPQDRSRLAICELQPFALGTPPIYLNDYNLPELGRMLFRRMVDGFQRLEPTKLKFHNALLLSGHDNRACDQFGTLLACADVLLNDWPTPDGLPDDQEVSDWVAQCRPQAMSEISDATSDHLACLIHIATTIVQSRGGEAREMIGTWIGNALGETALLGQPDSGADRARERLQQHGLKVVNARLHPERLRADGKTVPAHWGAEAYTRAAPGFLAIANDHQALAKVLEGTRWQNGVWSQALKRFEHALSGVVVKFGKVGLRSVLVPLSALFEDEDLPESSRADALAAWLDEQAAGPWGAD